MQRLAVLAALSCLHLAACVVDVGDDSDAELDETSEVSLESSVSIVTPLANNTPIAISGAAGSTRYYRIDVPANFDKLSVTRTGYYSVGASIYMKYGALPTPTSYECARLDGHHDSCILDRPVAGAYFIMVRGTTGYDFSLTARYWNNFQPLANRQSVTEGRGIGNDARYKLLVPANMGPLTIQLALAASPDTGEAEVFVKRNADASPTSYDCRFGVGYNYGQSIGRCTWSNPTAGSYYIYIKTIRRYEATLYAGYELPLTTGTVSPKAR